MQKSNTGNPAFGAKTRWLIFKYFIFIYLPLLFGLAALAYGYHKWESANIIEELKNSEMKQAELGRQMLERNFREAASDLLFLSEHALRERQGHGFTPQPSESLANFFFNFCKTKSQFLTIRLVDKSGREMLLANHLAGLVGSIPENLRRDWGEDPFFTNLLELPPGQYEVHTVNTTGDIPADLPSTELPTIRLGTLLADDAGGFAVVMILDYDGRILLDAVRQAGIASTGDIMLVGGRGDWLLGRNSDKEWSLLFQEHGESPVLEAFPLAWAEISRSEEGQFIGPEGLFTFFSTLPSPGSTFTAFKAKEPANADDGDPANSWRLISHVPAWVLEERISGLAGDIAMGYALLMLLLAPGCMVMARSRVQTMLDRDKFMRLNTSLNEALRIMGKRNRENSLINRLSDFLQACSSEDEIFDVAARYAGRLIPGSIGAIYDLREPDAELVEVGSWGEDKSAKSVFNQQECWAMRRGRPRFVDRPEYSHNCAHFTDSVPKHGYLCVPFIAQGKVLGLITFEFESGALDTSRDNRDETRESMEQLAMTLADHVALSLANLRLRESLREQSIRDALTGLYNRRHMQEALHREFSRAKRHSLPVSLIMFDVDHFKNFNDEHGHEAGDLVLKEMAAMLERSTRGEDIACRYGGEEFLIIMPGASPELARRRAEEFRKMVERNLVIRHGEKRLKVTVSLGVATYPEHAQDVEEALLKVDEAMYAAKQAGRNNVKMAD